MVEPAFPKGHRTQAAQLIETLRHSGREDFDLSLAPEMQTDKELVKVVPCQFCRRPLIVTTFYVLAWAKCGPCKGESGADREPGSVDVVQAGRTEPRLAKDLTKVLINPGFANALCPAHPDDPEHEMELKSVHFNERYGPSEWRIVDGKLTPVQIAPGETAIHQCVKCLAVVTYTTTAVTAFRRINEPVTDGKNANGWAKTLGARDSNLRDWIDKVDDYERRNDSGGTRG